MPAPSLDIITPLYLAICDVEAIASKLGIYRSGLSIFKQRPMPADATFPLIAIGPVIARNDEDGLNFFRTIVVLDINVYGTQGQFGSKADQYQDVELVADAIYSLFHRQRSAIAVTNWSVVDIRASGPSPAQADDENRVGRRVTLTIRLFASS